MECLFYYTGKSTFLCNKKASRGCARCAKEGCFAAAHRRTKRSKSRGDEGYMKLEADLSALLLPFVLTF